MGLLSKFFGLFKPKLAMIACSYGYSSSHGYYKDAWNQDTFRAIVDTIATHAAKGKVRHIRIDEDGKTKEIIHNSKFDKLLNSKPNPIMSAFEFKYRYFAQLEVKGTAIAYIKWNGTDPEMIMPVDYQNFDIREVIGGGYAVEFDDIDGKRTYLPLEDCIAVRKFYNTDLAAGDDNRPVLDVLDMAHAADEGFKESLETANKIRGIYKHKKAMLDNEDVEKSRKEFEKRFADAAKSGGIIGIDSMEDFTPLTLTNYSANAAQSKEISNRLYSFLHTPEEIVQSKYTETVGQAWYESVIEPLWQAFSEALTNASFTQREKDVGNRLIVTGGVMMGTSLQTRIQVIAQAKEIGLLTINEQRELLGYNPIEGGDVREVSLNYVNANKQSEYQVGKSDNESNNQTEDNNDD